MEIYNISGRSDQSMEYRLENRWDRTKLNNDYYYGGGTSVYQSFRYSNPFDYDAYSDCGGTRIIDVWKPMEKCISQLDGIPARIKFIPNYLSKKEADELYNWLQNNLDWQQKEGLNKNGSTYFEPRKTYWFGKPYKYSSVSWDENKIWDSKLDSLRERLCNDHTIENGKEYNSVMCNYYRDHQDSIGWHADDETSLGRYPKIASISLGNKRVFEVCKRKEYYSRSRNATYNNTLFSRCTILYRFHLDHGSLLIMEGSIQDEWLHRVPKEKKVVAGRINLTYRHIVSDLEEADEIDRRKNRRKSYSKHLNDHQNGSKSLPITSDREPVISIELPHGKATRSDDRELGENQKSEKKNSEAS